MKNFEHDPKKTTRRGLLAGLVSGALFSSGHAEAQTERTHESRQPQDIPSSSLDVALMAFVRANHLELFLPSERVANRTSSAVHGNYTPTETLQRLLSGTGCTGEIIQGAVTITCAPDTRDLIS